jgi:hypothetical protein
LHQKAEEYASRVKASDRMLWVEFARMSSELPYADDYFHNEHLNFLTFASDRSLVRRRAAMIESYFLTAFAELLMDDDFHELLAAVRDSSAQSRYMRKAAEALVVLVEDFQWERTSLANQRIVALAELARMEQYLRQDALAAPPEIKRQPQRLESGVVSAVGSDGKGWFCMIQGVDEVLEPGDVTKNVRVVEIYPDRVAFAKGRARWEQKVGAGPSSYWK